MTPLFVTLAIFAGLYVYAWLGRRIALQGGKVRSEKFGLADLFLGSVFVCWFGLLILVNFGRDGPRLIQTRDVIQSACIELCLVCVICGFLLYRKVGLVELFGLRRVALWKIPGLALLLLLAAYPLVGVAAAVAQYFSGGASEPQEIVQFFLEASKKPDRWPLVATVAMGALVAPMSEELIFRGYIYPMVKRYLGISAGVALNSALFAAIHMNKPSLFPLFVLAACFTLVYEATGSLLVSMTMHSLFNLVTFLALAALSRSQV